MENTNNCTLFPDGTWSDCCKRHDDRYESARLTKFDADRLLYRCVSRHNKVVAGIMFAGTTIFGWYWYFKAQRKSKA